MLEGRGADDPDCGNEKISDDSSRVALSFERRTKGKGKKSVSSAYRRPNCSSWRRALSGLLLLLDDTVDSFAEHVGVEGRREEEGTRTKNDVEGVESGFNKRLPMLRWSTESCWTTSWTTTMKWEGGERKDKGNFDGDERR